MDGGLNEPLNEILVLGRRGSGIDDNMELRQLSSQSGRGLDTASVSANGTELMMVPQETGTHIRDGLERA